mmetsp:Transcript_73083/g.136584  ORF Transcript_73083/g.136584 Transcript_73083/m.136584 type:complete len:248 (+) Transcript_73083:564-1307(+)
MFCSMPFNEPTPEAIIWKKSEPKRFTKTTACKFTLITPLPMEVAMKNVQKSMSRYPQHIPHMSNAAFGQEASKRTPAKPCFSVKSIVHIFIRLKASVFDLASWTSASNSESVLPVLRAVLEIRYGGNSPMAVPKPQSMHWIVTSDHKRRKVTVLSSFGPSVELQSSLQGWLYQPIRPVVVWHASAAVTTCRTWGNRNITPECNPVPKPTEDRMPKMIHQRASVTANSTHQSGPASLVPHTGAANKSG